MSEIEYCPEVDLNGECVLLNRAIAEREAAEARIAELEAGIRELVERVWNDDRTPVRVARELERLLTPADSGKGDGTR